MKLTGTFDVTVHPEPAFDEQDDVALSRVRCDKVFKGPLDARSTVWMTAAGTPVKGAAGYVAVERITGRIEGRRGSFVVLHVGVMEGETASLDLRIVPGSGTGELRGIAGTMAIDVVDGAHHYTLECAFAP